MTCCIVVYFSAKTPHQPIVADLRKGKCRPLLSTLLNIPSDNFTGIILAPTSKNHYESMKAILVDNILISFVHVEYKRARLFD
jgi:hypothetical protein